MADNIEFIEAKLLRVANHIDSIQSCLDTYSARNPPRLTADSQGKATLGISVPPPVEIAVLAGEAVYQMRSSLDHLAFDLVKLNPTDITLPSNWEKDCEFPIWTNLKPGQTPPMPYGCFKHLPGITEQAHAFIENVQPYYGLGKVNNCLRFLNQLSNIDKHRHLALTRMRSQMHEHRVMASGVTSAATRALDHGAQIDLLGDQVDGDATVEVDFMLSTFVTFNEPILGEGPSPCRCRNSCKRCWIRLRESSSLHSLNSLRIRRYFGCGGPTPRH